MRNSNRKKVEKKARDATITNNVDFRKKRKKAERQRSRRQRAEQQFGDKLINCNRLTTAAKA